MLILLYVLAVAGLIVAERFDAGVGKWIAKPIASAIFVAVAIVGGAAGHAYGMAILAGLALSFFGDVLLIPVATGASFRLGTAAFLLGHVAYSGAFLIRGVGLWPTCTGAVVVLVAAAAVLRWLGPTVPEPMRALVRAYVAVISGMLALALGTYMAGGDLRIVIGAAMFYVSDLSVARDRFVEKSFLNRLWGLPLYYGGQILLALTAT